MWDKLRMLLDFNIACDAVILFPYIFLTIEHFGVTVLGLHLRSPRYKIMGRKAGTLYINPKKFGNIAKPCMKEMITFLNCMSLNQMNSEKCVRQKELLSSCMDAQTNKKRKPWGSINYHLQRLNRGRK